MLNLSHFHVNGTVQTKQGRLVGVTHTRTTHMVGVRKGLGSDGLWPFHFWSPGQRTQRAVAMKLYTPQPTLYESGIFISTLCALSILLMFMLSLLIQSAS